MKKILKIIADIYLALFAVFWFYCMVNIFLDKGFSGIQKILSPFNISNIIVTVIFLFPYFILIMIADKVKAKEINKDFVKKHLTKIFLTILIIVGIIIVSRSEEHTSELQSH